MKLSNVLLTAAISGIALGAAACSHQDQPANSASSTASTAAKHACKGQNDCKGQGGCKTDKNACKGQNDCKGKGGCKTA